MSEHRNHHQTGPIPGFPWQHVLFTALAVLAVVGLIILIRKGGGVALAAADREALEFTANRSTWSF